MLTGFQYPEEYWKMYLHADTYDIDKRRRRHARCWDMRVDLFIEKIYCLCSSIKLWASWPIEQKLFTGNLKLI